jgi:hypothetical protein
MPRILRELIQDLNDADFYEIAWGKGSPSGVFREFVVLALRDKLCEVVEDRGLIVECSGIVVREGGKVQVGKKEMYAFAVYFDQISDESRYILIDYLNGQE